jgi:hypothetical protein
MIVAGSIRRREPVVSLLGRKNGGASYRPPQIEPPGRPYDVKFKLRELFPNERLIGVACWRLGVAALKCAQQCLAFQDRRMTCEDYYS